MSAPNLSIAVEPTEGGKAVYLPLAASYDGGVEQVKIVFCLSITNHGTKHVDVNRIVFSFPGSLPKLDPVEMDSVEFSIAKGEMKQWSNGQGDGFDNILYLDAPAQNKVRVSVSCDGFADPVETTVIMAPFSSPNGSGGFLFPFHASDLRPGEYMSATADHWANGGVTGTQIFAHDMVCKGGDGFDDTLPDTDGSKNAHYRIWGKPVRAIADGIVLAVQDGMDANTKIGEFPKPAPDPRGGNNIWVRHGDYAVVYCHFQKNSIPAKLKAGTETNPVHVKAGEMLGRAGNSGYASGPHTHIQCQKTDGGGPLRAFPWRKMFIVEPGKLDGRDGPWVRMSGQGVPKEEVVIWPLPRNPEWQGWQDLGGTIVSAPAVSSWAEHRLDVFAQGTDKELHHKWWDGAKWHDWQKLGGVFKDSPAAVSKQENRIDVFVRGTNDHLMHRLWNGQWSAWEDLGGTITSGPAASSWSNNRLDVFAKGSDDALWHRWWDSGTWHNWQSLGGTFKGSPAAVSWGEHRIDVFVRGMDDRLGHLWWNGTKWKGWEDLGGKLTGAPAVASWAEDRLDVFAKGSNGELYHKWWNGSHWRGWDLVGGQFHDRPAAVSWGEGRIDVFVRGMDDHLGHLWRS